MQKCFQPNSVKITKEEAQLIFQLRCRVTKTKINLRGKYDDLECEACGLEEESQQHIIECTELNKTKKEQEELKYEKKVEWCSARTQTQWKFNHFGVALEVA